MKSILLIISLILASSCGLNYNHLSGNIKFKKVNTKENNIDEASTKIISNKYVQSKPDTNSISSIEIITNDVENHGCRNYKTIKNEILAENKNINTYELSSLNKEGNNNVSSKRFKIIDVDPSQKVYHWSSIASFALFSFGIFCWIFILGYFLSTGAQKMTLIYLILLITFATSWILSAVLRGIAYFVYYRKKSETINKFKGKKLALPAVILAWALGITSLFVLIFVLSVNA